MGSKGAGSYTQIQVLACFNHQKSETTGSTFGAGRGGVGGEQNSYFEHTPKGSTSRRVYALLV